MSRIGKQPVTIPAGVKISASQDSVSVEGPKGKLVKKVDPRVRFDVSAQAVNVSLKDEFKAQSDARASFGLFRSLVANMVKGCAEGFKRELDVTGVGYKANVKGKELELSLGYSHVINYPIPEGIKITVDKLTHIVIEGPDKHLVGQTAAEIRSYRTPEPYKGKGVKYSDETILRKAGKSAAGSSG